MTLNYNGADITDITQVSRCLYRESSGGKCDSLDIEFENATGWIRWAPEADDVITAEHNGCKTGKMYVHNFLTEDGKMRMIATSLPCHSQNEKYRSYKDKTTEEIMRACAMETGFDYALYGLGEGSMWKYAGSRKEGCTAFLNRIARMEGAALKCVGGRYTMISLEWAKERAPQQTIEIWPDTPGCVHKLLGKRLKELTVETANGKNRAEDTSVTSGESMQVTGVPARDDIQAGRIARGLLLHENRDREILEIESEMNAGFAALCRIDITGGADTAGEWIVDEAEHDFIEGTSRVWLKRCLDSVR